MGDAVAHEVTVEEDPGEAWLQVWICLQFQPTGISRLTKDPW